MYYYIYDSLVQLKEHAKELAAVENRLADFGITGNIGRLSLFRDAGELVADEVKRGAKTIVVVGDDSTVRKVIDAVAVARATLAIIPIGASQIFGRLLGIPSGSLAVEVLAKRRLLTVDVGRVNGRYFLSQVRIPAGNFRVRCEGSFEVKADRPGALQIRNMGWVDGDAAPELGDPQDGLLDAVFDASTGGGWMRKATVRRSTIPVKKMVIEGDKPIPVFVDEEKYAHARLEVTIMPKRLRIIVGRDRLV